MKITEKKTITYESEVTIEILCNKCEKSMWKKPPTTLPEDSVFNVWNPVTNGGSLTDFTVSTGYATIRFSICPECLKEFTDSFKLPVTEEHQIIIG